MWGQNQRHEARERVHQLKTEIHTRRRSRQPSCMSLRKEQTKIVGEFAQQTNSPTNFEEETVLACALAGEGERLEAEEAEVRHVLVLCTHHVICPRYAHTINTICDMPTLCAHTSTYSKLDIHKTTHSLTPTHNRQMILIYATSLRYALLAAHVPSFPQIANSWLHYTRAHTLPVFHALLQGNTAVLEREKRRRESARAKERETPYQNHNP